MPNKSSRSQSAARIASRRLNPDVLERSFAQQSAIGDTIESHAPGPDQMFHAGQPMRFGGHPQQNLLSNFLDTRRHVHVALIEQRLGIARWAAKKLIEPPISHRQTLA